MSEAGPDMDEQREAAASMLIQIVFPTHPLWAAG